MTQKDFANELPRWKHELVDEVIAHYRNDNRERGSLAFSRWKERFGTFLKEHAPDEATRFDFKTSHIGGAVISFRLSAYEDFMRNDGESCIAFIDDLADSVLKGRVTLARKKSQKTKRKSVGHAQSARDQVFVSYSHKDTEWLGRLKVMLQPLVRNKTLALWDDTRIRAGSKWRREMKKALSKARVAVLLVSPDFLASDFIAEHELPQLLDAAEKKGLKILWICVSDCLYTETEIGDYQAANDPRKPLDTLGSELNKALVSICERIKQAATS